jgi:hypothetical protein
MTRRTNVTELSGTNQLAHTIESIGLAMLGALCGLFVAALIAKANIEAINSIGALFAAILYTSVGFYVSINATASPTNAAGMAMRDWSHPVKLIRAIGILLAAVAAVISVSAIIFDAGLQIAWIALVGTTWFIGATMQLAAGFLARGFRSTKAPRTRERANVGAAT